jgi:hypothetical protein
MKKIHPHLPRPSVLAIFFVSFVPFASLFAATGDYQLLAPLPSFGSSYNPGLFVNYVQTFIKLSITLSAILAVAFITIGGFQWMGGDSMQMKSDGKKKIEDAVLGLVILGASFLILNTINPALLNFKLEVPALITGESSNQTQTSYQVDDLTNVGQQIQNQMSQNPNASPTVQIRSGTADEQSNISAQCKANKPGSIGAIKDPTGKFYTCM